MCNSLKIAHLSDLHFSSGNSLDPKYEAVQNSLTSEKPDVIVVTGDIADNKEFSLKEQLLKKSFGIAKKYLEGLCEQCGIDRGRLFVVPGNHDYRYSGIFKTKVSKKLFSDCFSEYYKTRLFYCNGINLFVGCFDSNGTDSKVNFATGKVLSEEFVKFETETKQWQKESSFRDSIKIALLHHHPVPVYRKEIAGNFMDREGFLLLENGATFIREMLKNDIKLIFHGHQHHRGVVNVQYPIGMGGFKKIGVISSGSVGKQREGEYSFNIVSIHRSGQVSIDYRIARGEGGYERVGNEQLVLLNYEEARVQHYLEHKELMPTIVRKEVSSYTISEATGDLDVEKQLYGWHSPNGSLHTLDTEFKSRAGVFSVMPRYKSNDASINWVPAGVGDDGAQEGKISFNPPLTERQIDAIGTFKIPNAICFTKEDRLAATKKDSESESVGRNTTKIYSERLSMNIQYPPDFYLTGPPRVEVINLYNQQRNYEEERYCQKFLDYSPKGHYANFAISYPLYNSLYKIVWELPSEDEVEPEKLSALEKLNADNIKEKLLLLTPPQSDYGPVKGCLEGIYENILQLIVEIFKGGTEGDKMLEVNIMVYEKGTGALKYVAHYCPNLTSPSTSNIWNWKTLNGRPVAGISLKRKQFASKLFPEKPSGISSRYFRQPNCPHGHFLTAILAIPLMYPFDSQNIVAILEISTCSKFSTLLAFDKIDRKKKLAAKLALQDMGARENFLRRIGEAIGINNL